MHALNPTLNSALNFLFSTVEFRVLQKVPAQPLGRQRAAPSGFLITGQISGAYFDRPQILHKSQTNQSRQCPNSIMEFYLQYCESDWLSIPSVSEKHVH